MNTTILQVLNLFSTSIWNLPVETLAFFWNLPLGFYIVGLFIHNSLSGNEETEGPSSANLQHITHQEEPTRVWLLNSITKYRFFLTCQLPLWNLDVNRNKKLLDHQREIQNMTCMRTRQNHPLTKFWILESLRVASWSRNFQNATVSLENLESSDHSNFL